MSCGETVAFEPSLLTTNMSFVPIAVEAEAGMRLNELFAIHGEGYYRQLEHDVLERFLQAHTRAVLATGVYAPAVHAQARVIKHLNEQQFGPGRRTGRFETERHQAT